MRQGALNQKKKKIYWLGDFNKLELRLSESKQKANVYTILFAPT